MVCCTFIALLLSLPVWAARAMLGKQQGASGWRLHGSKSSPGYLGGRIRSFGFAMCGLKSLLETEPNARLHLGSAVIVIVLGIVFDVSQTDWMFLTIAIALVWIAEALNTSIEHVCNLVSPDYHPLVKRAKDVAAGAVLLSAICAAIIGLFVFATLHAR